MIWHSTDREQIINYIGTNIKTGLNGEHVKTRLEQDGENIVTVERHSFLNILTQQIKNFPLLLLIAATVIYTVVNANVRGFSIAEPIFIILLSAIRVLVDTYIIYHSENAVNKINKISCPVCKVFRNGAVEQILSSNLVVGDILVLSTGDYIAADARLIESVNLHCDESVLRGDTIDIQKDANLLVPEIAPLEQRINMLYAGCHITSGQGFAIVTETGNYTELAKRKTLTDKNNSIDPIKEKIFNFYKKFEAFTFCVCSVIYILSILLKMHSPDITFTSLITQRLVEVSAIAATVIPDCLLSLAAISISFSLHRMLKKNAILKNTQCLKTLSNIEVICSDKTGIFTTNLMTVTAAFNGEEIVTINNPSSSIDKQTANTLRLASLCSEINGEVADPTQTAITEACEQFLKLPKSDLEALYPRVAEIPFDSSRKLMTTVNMIDGTNYAVVKGAPESLIPLCINCSVEAVKDAVQQMSSDALRVIAVAIKPLADAPSNPTSEELENNLTFVGLLGLSDKLRSDAKQSIELCKNCGIKTVMITGDNISTASAIAKKLGILGDGSIAITAEQLNKLTEEDLSKHIENISVFAQVTPIDKLKIVSAYKALGKTVAVTGDASTDTHVMINADISFAKGINGNNVAKGAADVILTDDSFSTITESSKQVRAIFRNLRNAVRYILTCSASKLIFCLLGTAFFTTVPFTALQLLWLFVVCNIAPTLALSNDNPCNKILQSGAKNDEYSLFDRNFIINITWQSVAIAATALISNAVGNATTAFVTISIAYILLMLSTRTKGSIIFANYKETKSIIFAALVITLLTICTAFSSLFGFVNISFSQFLLAILFALIPTFISEAINLYLYFKK